MAKLAAHMAAGISHRPTAVQRHFLLKQWCAQTPTWVNSITQCLDSCESIRRNIYHKLKDLTWNTQPHRRHVFERSKSVVDWLWRRGLVDSDWSVTGREEGNGKRADGFFRHVCWGTKFEVWGLNLALLLQRQHSDRIDQHQSCINVDL